VPAVRREPGCIQYDLHRDQSKLGRFVMIEQWSDAKALKVHSDGAVTTGLLSGSFPVSLMAVRRLRWSIWPGLFDVSATVGEPAFRRVGSIEVVGIGIRSNF
jgi:Antibiotic biosynthesis monooxygenase